MENQASCTEFSPEDTIIPMLAPVSTFGRVSGDWEGPCEKHEGGKKKVPLALFPASQLSVNCGFRDSTDGLR